MYHETLVASDYGVLQARKRIIIVGWKKEADFGFPEVEKIINNYTANDALKDLPKLKEFKKNDNEIGINNASTTVINNKNRETTN